MLLSKEVAVQLNLASCHFKQFYAMQLRNKGIDLTPEQLLVLDMLWNEGEMSQQKIADSIGKDKNSVTKLVDALEKKGMVIRRRDSSDKRSNTIILTQKAESIKSATKEFGIAMLDVILKGISEEDLQILIRTLSRMSDNMDRLPAL